eukprot:jgi/Mesen1/2080/ME000151S01343
MAQKVAYAFSVVIDPAAPLVFDEGFLLDGFADWEGSLLPPPGAAARSSSSSRRAESKAEREGKGTGTGEGTSDGEGKGEGQGQGQGKGRKGLEEGEEGPVLAPAGAGGGAAGGAAAAGEDGVSGGGQEERVPRSSPSEGLAGVSAGAVAGGAPQTLTSGRGADEGGEKAARRESRQRRRERRRSRHLAEADEEDPDEIVVLSQPRGSKERAEKHRQPPAGAAGAAGARRSGGHVGDRPGKLGGGEGESSQEPWGGGGLSGLSGLTGLSGSGSEDRSGNESESGSEGRSESRSVSEIESGSESEIESDGSLQPYDMEDDEDDEEARKVPAQLRRCAESLRQVDDPNMVERALAAAEGLIRARADELDDVAPELANALLFLNCGAVAVDGLEDAAEDLRLRALVALLALSPVPALGVLTRALFSASMDTSQRLLVLDVMAGGCACTRARAHALPLF